MDHDDVVLVEASDRDGPTQEGCQEVALPGWSFLTPSENDHSPIVASCALRHAEATVRMIEKSAVESKDLCLRQDHG
ncbi:hypothetical protein A0U92_14580 [Acetobacter aceti]|uniref:Uncharacterized protein n=1 Tax=Acetobacter aceti TaxID=435 RepID=A0A1U9KJ02_ACEAC|nr:hypothetical protein A0U92_14580 [Acetobacter aceti]